MVSEGGGGRHPDISVPSETTLISFFLVSFLPLPDFEGKTIRSAIEFNRLEPAAGRGSDPAPHLEGPLVSWGWGGGASPTGDGTPTPKSHWDRAPTAKSCLGEIKPQWGGDPHPKAPLGGDHHTKILLEDG